MSVLVWLAGLVAARHDAEAALRMPAAGDWLGAGWWAGYTLTGCYDHTFPLGGLILFGAALGPGVAPTWIPGMAGNLDL